MTNPIPLLKILKQVQKNIKVITVCNLGYLMKELKPGNEYINAFYDGYICCFQSVVEALEKDLDE
jgi:hypothetical protein